MEKSARKYPSILPTGSLAGQATAKRSPSMGQVARWRESSAITFLGRLSARTHTRSAEIAEPISISSAPLSRRMRNRCPTGSRLPALRTLARAKITTSPASSIKPDVAARRSQARASAEPSAAYGSPAGTATAGRARWTASSDNFRSSDHHATCATRPVESHSQAASTLFSAVSRPKNLASSSRELIRSTRAARPSLRDRAPHSDTRRSCSVRKAQRAAFSARVVCSRRAKLFCRATYGSKKKRSRR